MGQKGLGPINAIEAEVSRLRHYRWGIRVSASSILRVDEASPVASLVKTPMILDFPDCMDIIPILKRNVNPTYRQKSLFGKHLKTLFVVKRKLAL